MKMRTLFETREALVRAVDAHIDVIKGKMFKRLFLEVKKELELLELSRKGLLDKHGTFNKKNNKKEVLPFLESKGNAPTEINPKYEAFLADFNRLLDEDVNLVTLKDTDLIVKDFEGQKLKTSDLIALDWVIKD